MNFKPGDLFFTVVEFFSVIVPGTMTLALAWEELVQFVPIPLVFPNARSLKTHLGILVFQNI